MDGTMGEQKEATTNNNQEEEVCHTLTLHRDEVEREVAAHQIKVGGGVREDNCFGVSTLSVTATQNLYTNHLT